jgi:UDP:flavonoid glycosyltransferase YjiC (YdhE family)
MLLPRGDVKPVVGLAVRLWALGAEVRVCAPPDVAERLAEVQMAGRQGAKLLTELQPDPD